MRKILYAELWSLCQFSGTDLAHYIEGLGDLKLMIGKIKECFDKHGETESERKFNRPSVKTYLELIIHEFQVY